MKLGVKYHITYCIIVFILCCIDYLMIINVDSGYWIYGIYIGIDRRQIRGEPASPFSYWGSTGQSPFFFAGYGGFLYVTAIPSIQSVPSLKESVKLLN